MAKLKHPEERQHAATTQGDRANDYVEGRRRRVAALAGVFGRWADQKDIPADGLDYLHEPDPATGLL